MVSPLHRHADSIPGQDEI